MTSLTPDAEYTPQQLWLIKKGLQWQAETGHPPKVKDWKSVRGTDWPSYQTAVRAFDTWDEFIRACGWEPRGRGRPSHGAEV